MHCSRNIPVSHQVSYPVLNTADDTHPNAISVIFSVYQLARANGYVVGKGKKGKSAMGEEMHVSAVCRPTEGIHYRERLQIDAHDKRIEVNCPRNSMVGGRSTGIYVRQPISSHNCGSRIPATSICSRLYC